MQPCPHVWAGKSIKDIAFFSKGKRGIIYTGMYISKYSGIKVCIKAKLPESKAIGRINNEVFWLRKLNKKGIGPLVLFSGKDFFVYKFIDGEFILEYLNKKTTTQKQAIHVIKELFNQLYVLDALGVNKGEMHHPLKHVLIVEKKSVEEKNQKKTPMTQKKIPMPVLIDFERCYKSEKPKNVTQFCQFLCGLCITKLLSKKGIRVDRALIINSAKEYKKKITKKNLNKIMLLLR